MMKKVIVKIDQILEQQGKTVYWLAKNTGISNNNLAKLVKNDTESIRFDILEKICDALQVEIEDVLMLK